MRQRKEGAWALHRDLRMQRSLVNLDVSLEGGVLGHQVECVDVGRVEAKRVEEALARGPQEHLWAWGNGGGGEGGVVWNLGVGSSDGGLLETEDGYTATLVR